MENINIYKYSRLSQSEILNLCKRAESNLSDYYEIVDQIIKNVEENKENALVEYSKKLDNVKSGLQEFFGWDFDIFFEHATVAPGVQVGAQPPVIVNIKDWFFQD